MDVLKDWCLQLYQLYEQIQMSILSMSDETNRSVEYPRTDLVTWHAGISEILDDNLWRCVDEQIRDSVIQDTPHSYDRRQYLPDSEPTLEDVLKKPL